MAGKITRQVQHEKRALCAVLLEARESARMTQRELATRLGWPYRTVQRIETGERRLAVEELFVFADALGTTPERILRAVRRRL